MWPPLVKALCRAPSASHGSTFGTVGDNAIIAREVHHTLRVDAESNRTDRPRQFRKGRLVPKGAWGYCRKIDLPTTSSQLSSVATQAEAKGYTRTVTTDLVATIDRVISRVLVNNRNVI